MSVWQFTWWQGIPCSANSQFAHQGEDCVICAVCGLTYNKALAMGGMPEDCCVRYQPAQPSSDQSSKCHSNTNYTLSLIIIILNLSIIRRSRTLSNTNRSLDTVLPLLLWDPLQNWDAGFELVWGFLVIQPTPPQKQWIAESQDACRKIKGFM